MTLYCKKFIEIFTISHNQLNVTECLKIPTAVPTLGGWELVPAILV